MNANNTDLDSLSHTAQYEKVIITKLYLFYYILFNLKKILKSSIIF
jgi:hypothetical protein